MKFSPKAKSFLEQGMNLHRIVEERLRVEAQALKISMAQYEESMLGEILDRELANWRQQIWLRETVNLREYPTVHRPDGSVKRVCVYIKGRWVGGYDIRVTFVQDEIIIEGVQLREEPDCSDAGGAAGDSTER